MFLLAVVIIATTTKSHAQTQSQHDGTTSFLRYDTVKVVLKKYTDSTCTYEMNVKAYSVSEVRTGDQTGKTYQWWKCFLNADYTPLKPDSTYIKPNGKLYIEASKWW